MHPGLSDGCCPNPIIINYSMLGFICFQPAVYSCICQMLLWILIKWHLSAVSLLWLLKVRKARGGQKSQCNSHKHVRESKLRSHFSPLIWLRAFLLPLFSSLSLFPSAWGLSTITASECHLSPHPTVNFDTCQCRPFISLTGPVHTQTAYQSRLSLLGSYDYWRLNTCHAFLF